MRPATAVLPLPVAMIEASFGTLLMSPVGTTPLTDSGLLAAGEAAITLAVIAVRAEKKQSAAFTAQAKPWPQNHFAKNRHAFSQAALDNGLGFVAG